MHDDLILAAMILDFLIECTTVSTFAHRKSLGICTYADLAKVMNKIGLIRDNPWTSGSIEKFFERLRKKHGVAMLKAICRYEDIGKPDWQFHFGDAASSNLRPRSVIDDTRKQTQAEARKEFPKRAESRRLDKMREKSWPGRDHIDPGKDGKEPAWLGSDLHLNELREAERLRLKMLNKSKRCHKRTETRRVSGKASTKRRWGRV